MTQQQNPSMPVGTFTLTNYGGEKVTSAPGDFNQNYRIRSTTHEGHVDIVAREEASAGGSSKYEIYNPEGKLLNTWDGSFGNAIRNATELLTSQSSSSGH